MAYYQDPKHQIHSAPKAHGTTSERPEAELYDNYKKELRKANIENQNNSAPTLLVMEASMSHSVYRRADPRHAMRREGPFATIIEHPPLP